MDLDLGAVRAFVAVAADRSFSAAADRLGLSQQAVSKRVARLEAHLGTPLLARTRGGAEPTAEGRAFLVPARALLVLADQAVERARGGPRPLRVDVLGTRLASTALIRGFHEARPDVEIEILTSDGLATAGPALLAGALDAFLGRATAALDEGIARVPAHLEPLHVLVGRGHRLAGRAHVRAAELAGTTAWMPGNARESEWVEFYRYLSADFGIGTDPSGPNFGLEHYVERIAASATLYGIVGKDIRLPPHPDIRVLPVVEPAPVFPWSLMWHAPNGHPALPPLIAHVTAGHRPFDPSGEWLPPPDRAAFSG
ncbi:LysR family transcriptional regulator [Actinomadura sp. NEAU-AAG7]|uniref:LysR family transcriptional regulator n=1 Tax=Actinomadura sp. NEAU-AAG7 TaxID=2839640 RepID=UPI001BE4A37D|nr:LysR family transcriptional regulator [Actinomadura sp. NEAU-AAG7]MBT2209228.1 LysR family transcriptional regulator [Actinomadura sp. NEAU-AAG7]